MELTKAVYRPLVQDESHKCGRDDCHEKAVILVIGINRDGSRGLHCTFCDIHLGEYSNNALLDLSPEKGLKCHLCAKDITNAADLESYVESNLCSSCFNNLERD